MTSSPPVAFDESRPADGALQIAEMDPADGGARFVVNAADVAADRKRPLRFHQDVAENDVFNGGAFAGGAEAAADLDRRPGILHDDIGYGAVADDPAPDPDPERIAAGFQNAVGHSDIFARLLPFQFPVVSPECDAVVG